MDEKHKRLLRGQRERKQDRRRASDYTPRTKDATSRGKIGDLYHDHYKKLLFITFGMFLLSIVIIGHTYYTTGDFFYKGVSLSGGITISVGTTGIDPIDVTTLGATLRETYPESDILIREISEFGTQQGITIEATTKDNSRESLNSFADGVIAGLSKTIPDARARASTEITGPSLGASFFEQTIKAVLIAFISMGFVVFIYFGETTAQKIAIFFMTAIEAIIIWYASNAMLVIAALVVGALLAYMYIKYSIPSAAVIISAISTITFTIAVIDIMQVRISTAGIAAFLMLIGYSVDTDILLSTRVLKSSSGSVYDRIVSTMKTGVTMTGTTFAAACVAYIFTQSDVIKEIMLIIMIGIIADIYNTWIQNAGILRMYLENKGRKSDDN